MTARKPPTVQEAAFAMQMASWMVVQLRSGRERALLGRLLIEKGVEAWAPTETVWRGRGPSRRAYGRPLLSSLIFAVLEHPNQLDDDEDVIRVLDPVEPIKLLEFILALRAAEAEGVFDRTAGRGRALRAGSRVRITHGVFAGVVCSLARMGRKGKAEVVGRFLTKEQTSLLIMPHHLEAA